MGTSDGFIQKIPKKLYGDILFPTQKYMEKQRKESRLVMAYTKNLTETQLENLQILGITQHTPKQYGHQGKKYQKNLKIFLTK